ncbi:hypothetical protein R1flu_024998 [Riccia fluitans]|uniref:Uncharacterized protein n=1 Tax=Riccia fluitans TaxID=41844 RepID=A0ABD1XZH5_9MARC
MITDFTGFNCAPEILSKHSIILHKFLKLPSSALIATPLSSANSLCNNVLPLGMLTPRLKPILRIVAHKKECCTLLKAFTKSNLQKITGSFRVVASS